MMQFLQSEHAALDGSIVLKTDDNFLVYLEPAAADGPNLSPKKRERRGSRLPARSRRN
jgi:hypothetical protein